MVCGLCRREVSFVYITPSGVRCGKCLQSVTVNPAGSPKVVLTKRKRDG